MGASPLFFFFKKAKFQNQVCARTSTTGLQTRLSVLSHNLLKHSPLPSLVFPFPFSGVFIHPFKIHLKALLSSTDSLQLKMSQTGYDPNNPLAATQALLLPDMLLAIPIAVLLLNMDFMEWSSSALLLFTKSMERRSKSMLTKLRKCK